MQQKLDTCLDETTLTEAFQTFDADEDGKLNLEEFEFFMSGFAKEYNQLRDQQLVKQMVAMAQKHVDADQKFEIKNLVQVLKEVWTK